MMECVLCVSDNYFSPNLYIPLSESFKVLSANFIRIVIHSYYITVIISLKSMAFMRHV